MGRAYLNHAHCGPARPRPERRRPIKPTNNRKMLADFARRLTPNAVLDPPDPTLPHYHSTTLNLTRGDNYQIRIHANDHQNHLQLTIHRGDDTLAQITRVTDLDLLENLMHQVITHHIHNPWEQP